MFILWRFRRQGINALAEQVNADVVALGHNLDDMAQTVLMNMANGDIDRTLRLAPHTDSPVDGLPPRIVPLRWIPEQEIHLLAMHKNFQCIMKNALMPKVLFVGDIGISLHKWNKMSLVLDTALFEWLTTLRWSQNRSQCLFVLIQ
jgi:hypothetical protein